MCERVGAHGSMVESLGGMRLSADYYVSTKLFQMFYTSVKFIVMYSGLRTLNLNLYRLFSCKPGCFFISVWNKTSLALVFFFQFKIGSGYEQMVKKDYALCCLLCTVVPSQYECLV